MLITTKDNLRGELYLSAIGHTLKAGNSTTVDNKYSNDPDILWAVSKGLIEVSVESDDSDLSKEDNTESFIITDKDYIILKNMGRSLLNLPFMTKSIDPNGTFTLSHEDFGRSEISMLIEKEIIEVVIEDLKKTTKKTKKASSKKVSSKKKVTNKKTSKEDANVESAEMHSPELADETKEDINKEKTLINENKPTGANPVTISFPEVDEGGIIFVDNNNEVN